MWQVFSKLLRCHFYGHIDIDSSQVSCLQHPLISAPVRTGRPKCELIQTEHVVKTSAQGGLGGLGGDGGKQIEFEHVEGNWRRKSDEHGVDDDGTRSRRGGTTYERHTAT